MIIIVFHSKVLLPLQVIKTYYVEFIIGLSINIILNVKSFNLTIVQSCAKIESFVKQLKPLHRYPNQLLIILRWLKKIGNPRGGSMAKWSNALVRLPKLPSGS